MIAARPVTPPAPATPLLLFRRLFENEFITLDGFAISCRSADGMGYIDESVALARMLADEDTDAPFAPADPAVHALHRTLYAAWPEAGSVVSGWSRHLRALLVEGLALPAPTSMMRKRGVSDLRDHLVEPGALVGSRVDATVAQARETAARNGMAHLLLVASDGMVVVAAPRPEEAMAHWHNVEFSARVECIRIEEASVQAPGGPVAD
jgi:ribulose-5-phosphate 4-epimerase/fuculose-1-phosphate aldolase